MSSEVSIIVRARDMATRVLRNIGAETQKLSKGLGFGGLAGGLAKGGAAFALGYAALRTVRLYVSAFKEAAQLARETGNYSIVSEKSLRAVDKISTFIRDWKMFAASNVSSLLDFFNLGGEATPGINTVTRESEQRIAAARADKAKTEVDRKMRDDPVAYLTSEQDRLKNDLKRQEVRQSMVLVAEKEAELASVSLKLEDAITKQTEQRLQEAKKLSDEKEREAKAAKDAADEAQKAYEADQERIAQAAQENFDRRAPLVERLRKAAVSPSARREMQKDLREQEKEQRKLNAITERADWKARMAILPGNENRRRFRLTKREAMALEANRLNQQDDAMAKSLQNVDDNTRKMLEALRDNLQLK